jgi:uncharacterized membrane protein YfcA
MRRVLELSGIGLAAGLFSSLFGVGGGTVIVPLLLARGWAIKVATATSLAAIIATAIFGAIRYGWSGDVGWSDAALIGVPAVAGSLLGVRLQRGIPAAPLQLGFAVLMVAVGVKLAVFP